MKAVILAGGKGTRLYPLTQVASKQLQAVYDKPMIYYPLTVLIAAGIRDFCLVTTAHDIARFSALLGDGKQWGISIEYRVQDKPEGIAQALIVAATFIGDDNVALMLGDNIFFGGDAFPRAVSDFRSGAMVFAYKVHNPSDYGVVTFNAKGKALSISEKPKNPTSNWAVPGVYLYEASAVEIARAVARSDRGEYEITDVNREYLHRGSLYVQRLSRGFVWLDAGSSAALHEASSYVEMIERRQGVKLGCPEEAALTRGFISAGEFANLIDRMPHCEYRFYLKKVLDEHTAILEKPDSMSE